MTGPGIAHSITPYQHWVDWWDTKYIKERVISVYHIKNKWKILKQADIEKKVSNVWKM